MDPNSYFSKNYIEARDRFIKAARDVGAELLSYPIASSGAQKEPLTIDVAILGPKNPQKTILISSGLHGVEGFIGSAVQLAWLDQLKNKPIDFGSCSVVLVHALNPYGFSWRRRVNENNVDLNRNFSTPPDEFTGSPAPLKELEWLKKPVPPEKKFFIIEWAMAKSILTHGFKTMASCLILGQFDYPEGLFWGGHKPEQTSEILKKNIDLWAQGAPFVLHLDLHSGLGRYGCCHLLTFKNNEEAQTSWLVSHFGSNINSLGTGLTQTGKPAGIMGEWIFDHFKKQNKFYVYLTLEYGTFSMLKIFRALYDENRYHRYPGPECEKSKQNLLQAFCPADPTWRKNCLNQGLQYINQALKS